MSGPSITGTGFLPPPPLPVRPRLPLRRRRRWRVGCLWAVVGGALVFVIPIFLGSVGVLLYLLVPPAPLDLLILGVDARSGEGYATRTDSIMVLGVNPAELNVSLFSIPRDLFIDTPAYGLQRANTINVLGEQDAPGTGAALVGAAIARSFQVQPDRYVRVNFNSFVRVVDVLGGIDVEVPARLVDTQYPTPDWGTTTIIFEPGWQHMDGETALAYARTRHADDDYRRAGRQQQVVEAIFRALFRPENWLRLPAVLTVFGETVDTDLTLTDLLLIAPPILRDGVSGGIDRLVIDRDLVQRSPEGNAVPNYAAIIPWLEERFD